MELVCLGLSHKTAPVVLREKFSIPINELASTAEHVRSVGGSELFVVSTCNRTEVYAAAEDVGRLEMGLVEHFANIGSTRIKVVREHLYLHRGQAAVRHLFRVAASLDSLVVGEPQILGQLKVAFEACRAAGLTGAALNRAVERAFAVAKRVRTETGIGRSSVSISSVAVDLAAQIFGSLEGRCAVMLGAGEMGEIAARHLKNAGVERLLVANRSMDRAQAVAADLGGQPRGLHELPALLVQADIVVACTGARGYLFGKAEMKKAMRARKYRPIFLIDIAVPRNIDPAVNRLDNAFVYDVDDLSGIANENLATRQREAELAEAMVGVEAERFLRDLAGLTVKPTIMALRKHAAVIKRAEIDKSMRRLGDLSPQQLKSVERLADGIVNTLLHDVLMGLKEAAAEPDGAVVVEATRRLFRLDNLDEESS
jgi:glutamyl-tRNA reductase